SFRTHSSRATMATTSLPSRMFGHGTPSGLRRAAADTHRSRRDVAVRDTGKRVRRMLTSGVRAGLRMRPIDESTSSPTRNLTGDLHATLFLFHLHRRARCGGIGCRVRKPVRTTAPAAGRGFYGYRLGYRAWGAYPYDIETVSYKQGTLAIDVIDANRNTLVWQGVAQGRLDAKMV